jgi:hypothetical protein
VHKALLDIESIFPPDIKNSKDTAYLNYLKLRKELEEEIDFQSKYFAVLDYFNKEKKSRGNPAGFLDEVESFIKYFSGKDKLLENVVKESQDVLKKRLAEMVPFYQNLLSGKDDGKAFDKKLYRLASFKQLGALHEKAGLEMTKKFSDLSSFVNGYDERTTGLAVAQDSMKQIAKTIKDLSGMPDNDFFPKIVARASSVPAVTPKPMGREFGKYTNYKCSQMLNKEILDFAKEAQNTGKQYRMAEFLVPQVNELKEKKDYSAMLGLLKKNMELGFLIDKYRHMDKVSVDEQADNIRGGLKRFYWAKAEGGLTKLHFDKNSLDYEAIKPLKRKVVLELEDSLYIQVDRLTRERVSKFCEEKISVLEDVDSLYEDSVFLPAHDIKFSSGSKAALVQRKEDLIAHLAKLKEDEFPAKAIQLLYDEFLKNPRDNGVLKARAIVTHGKHYKGDDKKTKRRMAECNPWSAKWITKPTEYRRVFALPFSTRMRGVNNYVLRINIRIPTEAKFPVYEVNLKLPKQVAKDAASDKWYEKITINKKIYKSEGRFSITAPNAENNYECQISPVRVIAGKSNYLDIYFNHKSFKVHPVSVMVQKPIIKKN